MKIRPAAAPATMPTDPTICWYDQNAASQAERYESVDASDVFEWSSGILPDPPGLVIDLGAGSGRDAAWFAAKGFEVLAVEPAAGMRAEGQRRHGGLPIQWLDDRLPALAATIKLGVAADVVNLGAVWMHLASEEDRRRAFRKVVSLTRSGGVILISVRNKPFDDVRTFKSTTVYDIESLAREHGLVVARVACVRDGMGRGDVSWDCVALRLPHDGTDALPLLRHVILNDSKSTTYKLALLRSLCRAAESAAGMAVEAEDDHVAVPLGLVALFWMRLYAPLLAANLPQSPQNERQGKALGFVNDAFAAILCGRVPVHDLRVGAKFWGDDIAIVHEAIKLSAQTIRKNPATFTTYSDGTQVFPCTAGRLAMPREPLTIDARYLESFGSLRAPLDVWRAMQRFASWIEPSIVAEWTRIMKGYARNMERQLDEAVIAAATTWTEPDRDVDTARRRALAILDSSVLFCAWSGKRLDATTLDIDHAFPWSAWPCGDLWNLLPAHRSVNQHKKREKLPTDRLLLSRRDEILSWWRDAYERTGHLASQFAAEARTSLPLLGGEVDVASDAVFDAMRVQRLRLWRDQQIPEWNG